MNYKCDECGKQISEQEYFENDGLCENCYIEEHPEIEIEEW